MEKRRQRRHCKGELVRDLDIVRKVLAIITSNFDLTQDQLLGRRRKAKLAKARVFAMYLLNQYTHFSYAELGMLFNRDHTTIVHAVQQVNGYKKVKDPYIRPLTYIEDLFFIN